MNKQRKFFSLRLLFSVLLLIFGASLLFNALVTRQSETEKVKETVQEKPMIKAKGTEKTYTGTIEKINNDEDSKFSSFFLTNVEGKENDMFKTGVNIYADKLNVCGKKSSFSELEVGDKIELITVENAPVTMMLPPSIAGNAVIGINVL